MSRLGWGTPRAHLVTLVSTASLVFAFAPDAHAWDSPPRPELSVTDAGTWVPTPRDTRQAPALAYHAAVYDSLRDRLLLFGGTDGHFRNDVWELPLGGAPDWRPLATLGTPPTPRVGTSSAYDPVRDRLVVVGGHDATTDHSEVWALSLSDPPTWTLLSADAAVPAPSPRAHQTVVYDPRRDRLVLFGGFQYSAILYLSDTWAFDLSGAGVWTNLSPAGAAPLARAEHVAIYDPVRDRMVVEDGSAGNLYGVQYDMFALSLSASPTWSTMVQGGDIPEPRREHAAAYDPLLDGLVIYGGNPNSGLSYADTRCFEFGTSTWRDLAPAAPPPGRSVMAVAYDTRRRRMLIEGGQSGGGSDCWALASGAPGGWTLLSPIGAAVVPPARAQAAAIYDPIRQRMLLFGGVPNAYGDLTVWSLSLAGGPSAPPTWEALTTTGTPPGSPLYGIYDHRTVYDPVRDRMLVIGASMTEIPTLSLAGTPAWSTLAASGGPPQSLANASVIYDPVRDRLLMYGGSFSNFLEGVFTTGGLWQLSLGGPAAWSQVSTLGPPPPTRAAHTAVYDAAHDRMLVFGGFTNPTGSCCGGQGLKDLWQLSLAGTPSWTQLAPTGPAPGPRSTHTAVVDPLRSRMLIYGSAPTLPDTTWALSLEPGANWTPLLPAQTAPALRFRHVAVFDPHGDRLVVYGGQEYFNSSNYLGDLWQLRFDGVVSVPGGRPSALAVLGTRPSPAVGTLHVAFRLADATPARLEVFDLAGRRMWSRALGRLGAGLHEVTLLDAAQVHAGVYLLRIEQDGHAASARAVVLR